MVVSGNISFPKSISSFIAFSMAEKLKNRLDEYKTWLNEAAPALRNLTGSQLSGAIERYDALTVEKDITDKEVHLHLGACKISECRCCFIQPGHVLIQTVFQLFPAKGSASVLIQKVIRCDH